VDGDHKEIDTILVVCDNFWVGGRETFLVDSLALLRKHGLKKAYLVAHRVSNPQAELAFDQVFEITSAPEAELNSWYQEVESLTEGIKIDLVWAQHYAIMPALLLAAKFNARLHITFHGPPLTAAPLDIQSAFAAALALHNGASYSGVSQEILDQIAGIYTASSDAVLLPNKVQLPNRIDENSKSATLNMVLLSRQSKLEHIRAACRLFVTLQKSHKNAVLTIHTGITQELGITATTQSQSKLRTKLLGRKWLLRHPTVALRLNRIFIRPLTNTPSKVIQNADIILGMGRVVLEGLAHGRPTVLIGYEEAIDAVDVSNFSALQQTNFSGRMQIAQDHKAITNKIVGMLPTTASQRSELQNLVSIDRAWSSYQNWRNTILRHSRMGSLSTRTSPILKDSAALLNDALTEAAATLLTPKELTTYQGFLSAQKICASD
jgi:hypothetical protein